MEVMLSNIPVMFVYSENGVSSSAKTFNLLESKLPSLKKRKFYGVVEGIPPNDKYRACVAITERDNPKAMGLNTWMIPGGKYAWKKIDDWGNKLQQVGPAFESLIKQYSHDPTRPSIEFYRSMKELILLLPIK